MCFSIEHDEGGFFADLAIPVPVLVDEDEDGLGSQDGDYYGPPPNPPDLDNPPNNLSAEHMDLSNETPYTPNYSNDSAIIRGGNNNDENNADPFPNNADPPPKRRRVHTPQSQSPIILQR